ncbi:hypothetical protein BCR43DRAFT_459372 [Syncephalastrum racemosum]|uniref:Rho-GAP domain-containing protein n=1 Tax=Syncephalastrum racemosum TaxID=13706 RepID=A0A1X2HA47_SYNRA|nr:hypothetical protein BCR43DRAFT_459372 [Syncephalastrum racemosum]
MHRPRGRSISQREEEQPLPNIDAHLDFINKLLKWSIQDFDRFISLLKARIAAEESYIQSLEKLNRHAAAPEPDAPYTKHDYFGDHQTSFEVAVERYEQSLEGTIACRRELVQNMKTQMQVLYRVKEDQKERRNKVKNVLGEKNTNYLSYRTRDFVKRHKAYTTKCAELDAAQQQFLQQPGQEEEEMAGRLSIEDNSNGGRKSSDSGYRDTDAHSTSSLPENHSGTKRGMAGFMALRTQIANAMASTDPSKQNTRLAKLKREVVDADQDYRKAVVLLERFRKKQVETARIAIKHVEVLFLDKSEWTREALRNILTAEHAALLKEASLVQGLVQTAEGINGRHDAELFKNEYQKNALAFVTPQPFYYVNHVYGRVKDVLFGSSLEDYARAHNRTVPLLVQKCIHAVESQGGLQREGIYRVSGRMTKFDTLKIEFEKDEEGIQLDEHKHDIFTIASVLKVYLRELDQPLFPLSVQYRMDYSNLSEAQRLPELQTKLSELPEAHRDTLNYVIQHLARVAAASSVNKMTVQNLAVIFTPAIFHDHNQGEHPGEWCSDKVFEDLIQYHESIFVAAEKQKRADEANKGKKATPKQPSERPPEVLPVMDKTLLQTAEGGIHPDMKQQASADAVDIDFGPPLGEMLSRSDSTPTAAEGTSSLPPAQGEKKGTTQLGRKGSIRFRPRQDSLRRKPSHHVPSTSLGSVDEGPGRANVGHSRTNSNSSGLNQPSSLVFPTPPPPVPSLPIATAPSAAAAVSSTPAIQPLPQPHAASLSAVPPSHATTTSPPSPAPVPNPRPDLTPQAPTIASSAPPTITPIIQTTAASPPATASPATAPLETASNLPVTQLGSAPASAPANSSNTGTAATSSDAKR